MTTDAPPEDSGRSDRLIQDVSDAARSLRDAEDQHRESARRLSDTLLAAHEGGYTWSEIARAADLGSAETARGRAYRARETDDIPPSLRWRHERGRTPRPDTDRPGLSVTEAAKRLGISRDTVYAWIRSGKLNFTPDDAGRPRVLLEDD